MIEAKLGPELRAQYDMMSVAAQSDVPVIVKYRAPLAGVGVVRTLRLPSDESFGVARHYSVIAAVSGRANRAQIGALTDDPNVEMVWYDSPVHVMLDVSVPLIGAPKLWQNGFTGKGIKLCIVDTGIDPDHADFAGRIADLHDFTGEGVRDGHGHGTHCASIAAGSGAASGGKYRGVAPEATILVAKVLAASGAGSTSDVMAGVEWAVQHGAHVISLSLGSDGTSDGSDALSQTCDAAMQMGHVVCVAAGNAGPSAGTVGSPGAAKLAITIGATDDTDAIASFSSRGPTADGRVKPDVCFPGVRIVAARAKGTSMGRVVDDNYTEASGTSMATPHAAGASALLLQAHPGATPAQIKDALMTTARNLGLDANTMGAGRAQLDAANRAITPPAPEPTPTPAPQPSPTPAPEPSPSPAPAPSPSPTPAPAPEPTPPGNGQKGCLPAAMMLPALIMAALKRQ